MKSNAIHFWVIVFSLFFINVVTPCPAQAIVILRDDEVERFLKDISAPMLEAANVSSSDVSIILVGDDAVNAYVAGGQNIFVYSGLIERTDNIDELIGVIAHEIGHIASGHLVRGMEAIEKASYQAILSTVLGVAVGVASGDPQAGMGVSLGGAEVARRSFLKNSRTFESSADQAALSYFDISGYSANGLQSFLDKLASQDVLPTSQQDEYVMTHPISRDRINFISERSNNMKPKKNWSPAFQERYSRVKAKIIAYQHPERASQLYDGKNDVISNYAIAIAAYRSGDMPKAISIIDKLIKQEPANPYFFELKGQMLFEDGKGDLAIDAYRLASKLLPSSGLIAIALGHALIEKNTPATDDEAIRLLQKAIENEKHSPEIYRFLSIAYGRNKNEGLAKLCLAEEAFLKNNLIVAGQQARAAQNLLEKNTPSWNRAEDLIKLAKDIKM